MDGTKTHTPEEIKAIMAALPPDKQAKLAEILKKGEKGSRRKSEVEIRKDYPNVIEGSLRWNETAGKQMVDISCSVEGCEDTREVFTSDLFQVKTCLEHRKVQRAEARKARVAERDNLIAEGKKALAAKGQ